MNIFEREISKEELNEVLNKSIESKGIQSLFPMRMYNMAKETYQRNEIESKIREAMYKGDRKNIENIIIINDNLAIIETFEHLFGEGEKPWFRIYIDGHISSTVCQSLDEALLHLVARKNNMGEASQWICRMIGLYSE